MQKCWVICSCSGSAPEVSQVQFHRVLDQSVDPQPVVDEVAGQKSLVLLGFGVLPVVPEVRGDVLLGVFARLGVDVLEQALRWSDERENPLAEPPVDDAA